MSARKPLDYQPQNARIFRPREEVEQELERVEQQDERTEQLTKKRTDERLNERINGEGIETFTPASAQGERRTVRHSFDIYADQLQALGRIQLARWSASGKKPKMGTLVQEALDTYIRAQDKPETDEGTDERTDEGTDER